MVRFLPQMEEQIVANIWDCGCFLPLLKGHMSSLCSPQVFCLIWMRTVNIFQITIWSSIWYRECALPLKSIIQANNSGNIPCFISSLKWIWQLRKQPSLSLASRSTFYERCIFILNGATWELEKCRVDIRDFRGEYDAMTKVTLLAH